MTKQWSQCLLVAVALVIAAGAIAPGHAAQAGTGKDQGVCDIEMRYALGEDPMPARGPLEDCNPAEAAREARETAEDGMLADDERLVGPAEPRFADGEQSVLASLAGRLNQVLGTRAQGGFVPFLGMGFVSIDLAAGENDRPALFFHRQSDYELGEIPGSAPRFDEPVEAQSVGAGLGVSLGFSYHF